MKTKKFIIDIKSQFSIEADKTENKEKIKEGLKGAISLYKLEAMREAINLDEIILNAKIEKIKEANN